MNRLRLRVAEEPLRVLLLIRVERLLRSLLQRTRKQPFFHQLTHRRVAGRRQKRRLHERTRVGHSVAEEHGNSRRVGVGLSSGF